MVAWAVTIHKSQGKTLDRVYIDLGNGAFASGQVYVAPQPLPVPGRNRAGPAAAANGHPLRSDGPTAILREPEGDIPVDFRRCAAVLRGGVLLFSGRPGQVASSPRGLNNFGWGIRPEAASYVSPEPRECVRCGGLALPGDKHIVGALPGDAHAGYAGIAQCQPESGSGAIRGLTGPCVCLAVADRRLQ